LGSREEYIFVVLTNIVSEAEGSSKSLKLDNLVYHKISKTRFFFVLAQKIYRRFGESLNIFGLQQKKKSVNHVIDGK
jgi:hypothetical protein